MHRHRAGAIVGGRHISGAGWRRRVAAQVAARRQIDQHGRIRVLYKNCLATGRHSSIANERRADGIGTAVGTSLDGNGGAVS